MGSITTQQFQELALRLAPSAAAVANFCDHVEHNEWADRAWVLDAAEHLREVACLHAIAFRLSPIALYAERLGMIEAGNVLARPGGYDGRAAALAAATWRDLQLVQMDHDRFYHPDVLGMAKDHQLRHYALHLTKVVGAFAEPREEQELLHRRLPDVLLFGMKLTTVMGARLAEEPLPTARRLEAASGPRAGVG